ncbi:MAG TPA: isoprenylcysteine carboxylmethyltransferase family protein, partial [Casimicrobiaceae bacterium]|nr:isoprenylcysteine carboxylmethyltransferase family protein [Casimicrobiaceae bacterium]
SLATGAGSAVHACMPDVPLVVLIAVVWAYWIIVGAMVIRLRRKNRKLVGLVPEQRVERYMWLVWVPLVAAWMFLPYAAASRTTGTFALPPFAQGGTYGIVRWIAAVTALVCLLASIDCWRRMGDDWRMDIGARKTNLVTDGLFRRVRHPIYAFSMLLMVCSALIVPTLPMIAIALAHLALMNVKARNEERHLTAMHGDSYQQYVARTGRFFPRFH